MQKTDNRWNRIS